MPFFSLVTIALLLALIAVSPARAAAPKLTPADRAKLELIKSQAEGDLTDDILPFWTKDTLDPEFGGYLTVVDRYGRPMANTDKYVVMQARMVWTLSAAYDYGIHSDRYKSFAAAGVKFITEKMWDPQYGGFYMSVHRDGTPADTSKRLYAQEFVLYALSEYARVFHDKAALGWAEKTWAEIQAKTADPNHGGYREDFDQQWNPIADSLGVGGTPSGKTINVHMHLMEALTAFVRADPKPEYKKALADVVDLIRAKSITKAGYAMEPFDRDWNPKPDGQGRMSTFYGHDVELAWLMRDAYVALGRNPATVEPELYPLIDNALQYGFDWDKGGLASIGPRGSKVFGDPAYATDLKQKEWWEQAELLVALSTAYRYTGKQAYLDAFEKEWGWVWDHQIDHAAGDWFSDVDFNTGAPLTLDKGLNGWKVCYHDGRALMEVSKNLSAILGEKE
jgi:mannose/cellobiose epimerase-like protein (N-acyl-D-glucosamine 2-epimerase family)